jgi:hypothetical protein
MSPHVFSSYAVKYKPGLAYVQLSECRKLICIRYTEKLLAFMAVDFLLTSKKNLKNILKGSPSTSTNFLDEKNVDGNSLVDRIQD